MIDFMMHNTPAGEADSLLWLERDDRGQVTLAMGNERFRFTGPHQLRLLAAALQRLHNDTSDKG